MHQEHGARGFSFQLEEAPSEAPTLGRLDLDWSDLAPSPPPEREPTKAAAPAVSSPPGPERGLGQRTPLMPHAAAAGRIEPPARPLLHVLAQVAAPTETRTPTEQPTSSIDAPVVRRLRFPAGTPAASKPSPRPSTRFADSIGRVRIQADSTADLGPRKVDEVSIDEPQALPEDLPERSAQADLEVPTKQAESVQPSVLLRQAGTLWASAKSTATDLGGRGLESSRILAGQMSDALRERLERKLAAHAGASEGESNVDAEAARSEAKRPTTVTSAVGATAANAKSSRPRLAWARAAAGPMLALVAALGMFIGSRQLLGGADAPLSRTAPAIPDLGEVGQTPAGSQPTSPATNGAGPAGAPAGSPPPMVTEVVPLPAGMAWPGKGLLEVVTSEDELVYVDGVFTGRGPLRRVPVTPGAHEISIRKEGSERHGTAEVEPGRTTRALFRN